MSDDAVGRTHAPGNDYNRVTLFSQRRSAASILVACALGVLGAWIEYAVLSGGRFSSISAIGGRWFPALLVGVTFSAAVAGVLIVSIPRAARQMALLCAFALSARFVLPAIIERWHRLGPAHSFSQVDAELAAYLRGASAAQEQFRLAHGTYASTSDSLVPWVAIPNGSTAHFSAHGAAGWAGEVRSHGGSCSIWVRDTTLRIDENAPEGSPRCGSRKPAPPHGEVHSVLADGSQPSGRFKPSDIDGLWVQHRGDAQRSSTVSIVNRAPSAFRWTASIGGELKAPVAIAGNQVFAGAHGNGEFDALSLDRGTLGWRVRVPNFGSTMNP